MMAVSYSRDRIVEICLGQTRGAGARLACSGVEYDSREVSGGELFVCLKGSQYHGHHFINGAFSRGASLFLVENTALWNEFAQPERLVLVDDTLKAFWKLASAWRLEIGLPLVAVTGSVGKTTTKEILAALALRESRGTFSLKSHNNHVGVPYTMCRIGRDHEWAVLEMGMNHAGELRDLSMLAAPDLAIITAIAPAHLEAFPNIRAIADAKFEIVEGLSAGKTLIINGDDAELVNGVASRNLRSTHTVLTFGCSDDCEARVSGLKSLGLDGIEFKLSIGAEEVHVDMRVLGKHNALNAACAALALRVLMPKLSLARIAQGLNEFRAPLMRLNVKQLRGGRRLVDDSYNANPASMHACLELAKDLISDGVRVGLILGDMAELGPDAPLYHDQIGEAAAQVKPTFFIAVGQLAQRYMAPLRANGVPTFHAESPEAAGHIVGKMDFDIVMVKASRAAALDRAVATVIKTLGE